VRACVVMAGWCVCVRAPQVLGERPKRPGRIAHNVAAPGQVVTAHGEAVAGLRRGSCGRKGAARWPGKRVRVPRLPTMSATSMTAVESLERGLRRPTGCLRQKGGGAGRRRGHDGSDRAGRAASPM
jgi:hypothetical protein